MDPFSSAYTSHPLTWQTDLCCLDTLLKWVLAPDDSTSCSLIPTPLHPKAGIGSVPRKFCVIPFILKCRLRVVMRGSLILMDLESFPNISQTSRTTFIFFIFQVHWTTREVCDTANMRPGISLPRNVTEMNLCPVMSPMLIPIILICCHNYCLLPSFQMRKLKPY